jgi:hypothetical protein
LHTVPLGSGVQAICSAPTTFVFQLLKVLQINVAFEPSGVKTSIPIPEVSGTSGPSRLTLLKLMTMPVELPAVTDMPMSVPGRGAAGLVSVLLVTVTSWAPNSSTAVPALLPPTPACASPLPKIVLFCTVPAAPTIDTPFCAINPPTDAADPRCYPTRS